MVPLPLDCTAGYYANWMAEWPVGKKRRCCGQGLPPMRQVAGHDREVVTSQSPNPAKQLVSLTSTLPEATGKLPCGVGQSVTSPTAVRAG